MSLHEKLTKLMNEHQIQHEILDKHIESFIEQVSSEDSLHTLDYVKNWYEKKRAECTMEINEIPIKELQGWYTDSETGVIKHDSGEFFSIIGINVGNTSREVSGWTQPIVAQKEMGVLGILCKKINNRIHYLLHAKAEPGNVEKLQLSPTLQATYSNLKMAHGGRKPRFAEYFIEPDPTKVRYSKWLAEDGGRFYLKTNLNMLVELDEDDNVEIPHDCIWVTLNQIKDLLHFDNYIGPHVRSILCHL